MVEMWRRQKGGKRKTNIEDEVCFLTFCIWFIFDMEYYSESSYIIFWIILLEYLSFLRAPSFQVLYH